MVMTSRPPPRTISTRSNPSVSSSRNSISVTQSRAISSQTTHYLPLGRFFLITFERKSLHWPADHPKRASWWYTESTSNVYHGSRKKHKGSSFRYVINSNIYSTSITQSYYKVIFYHKGELLSLLYVKFMD